MIFLLTISAGAAEAGFLYNYKTNGAELVNFPDSDGNFEIRKGWNDAVLLKGIKSQNQIVSKRAKHCIYYTLSGSVSVKHFNQW